MRNMELAPITPHCGAEVVGIDLSVAQEDETIATIDRALETHGVLVFRDQHVDVAAQRAFAARFGELHQTQYAGAVDGFPEVTVISERIKGATSSWHADSTFEPTPPRGSLLRFVEGPAVGGDTLWASTHAAFASLSSAMQRLVDGLTAQHDSHHVAAQRQKQQRGGEPFTLSTSEHPVVLGGNSPGRKSLFVNSTFTARITELSETESNRVLSILFETIRSPDLQVRVRWEPGTLAFWSNYATQHYAVPDYDGTRTMHRCTLVGGPPR